MQRLVLLGLFLSSWAMAGAPVADEARSILRRVRETHYTHDIYINPRHGIYDTDCSGFAEHVLEQAAREAGREVADAATGKRPLAKDFTRYLDALPGHETRGWEAVRYARHLKEGDLIAWLLPAGSTSPDTGHVMIVVGPPRKSGRAGEYLVPIIDATLSGHGTADRRRKAGPNGVGTGVVGIAVDGNDRPIGFYWSGGESPTLKTTTIRFGRPRALDFSTAR